MQTPNNNQAQLIDYISNKALVIAVSGHITAGKTTFTRRLKDTFRSYGIKPVFVTNFKMREVWPSEVPELDIYSIKSPEEWEQKKDPNLSPRIIGDYKRGNTSYGFSSEIVDKLKNNEIVIVNADINGLPILSNSLNHFGVAKSKIIEIGLYCQKDEALRRISCRTGAEDNIERYKDLLPQLKILKEQFPAYQNHWESFRMLFYNNPPNGTIDHLVSRALDLIGRQKSYESMDNEQFRSKYIEDACLSLTGYNPMELEGRLQHANGSEGIKLQDSKYKAQNKIVSSVNSYGIYNIFLADDSASQDEKVRSRQSLQEAITSGLGVPQTKTNGNGIHYSDHSNQGLVREKDGKFFSFLVSFSAADCFPLLAHEGYVPLENAPLHTLAIHLIETTGKKPYNINIAPFSQDQVIQAFKQN